MRVFTPLLSFLRLLYFLVMVWSVMVSGRGDPSFLTQPVTVSALAQISDGPAPVHQWLKDAVAIPGATRRTLELSPVTVDQTGSCAFMALNPVGPTRDTARLIKVRSLLSAVVTTVPVMNVTGSTVFGSNPVSRDRGAAIPSGGVVVGQVAEPTLITDAPVTAPPGNGLFVAPPSLLEDKPTYHAGTYVASTISRGCGSDITMKTAPATPSGFSLISAGTFQMGDSFGEGDAGERPLRQVTVSAFYMAQRETTKALWDEVRAWGVSRGYTDLAVGGGKASHHPVQNVTWFDVIKWCNARSEKEGLVPCYTVGGTPLRTGTAIPVVHWTATGYRLPTEAEWEKAARGGLNERRFPWGDTITHSQVNYQSNERFAPDISPMRGFHPTYDIGNFPYTSPVGSFTANEYGLYDMTGNVWEWCWDWYGTYPSGAPTDPRGSASGSVRVHRGGSWGNYAYFCRVSARDRCDPLLSDFALGFRVVLFADSSARAAPIVTTGVAVAGDGAALFTVSGSVTSEGGSPVTARGVVYGLVPEPTLTSAMTSPSGSDTGDFSSTLANLALDTTYYARAYATNELGTRYGAEITFKTASASPVGFSLIPAGTFQMGDSFGEGDAGERPLRQVTVSAFYMAQRETTKSLWDEVRAWAVSRGYTDLPVGGGKAATHPVHWVTWFDVTKWCNARSEKEGLTPCYTAGGSPLRTGTAIPVVNWTAKGYRLPTEAEWEKAARGGLKEKRFPWGDTIDHSLANYNSSSTDTYDISPTLGLHPTYAVGSWPNTSPVGSFAANGYGLYDMIGNIYEWCWDWFGRYAPSVPTDPQGSSSGTTRVMRGGSFYYSGNYSRSAYRNRSNPLDPNYDVGFRLVRGQ